jgi:hypothetical protein
MQRVKAGPNGGKGYQLREAVVTQDAANWPTPDTSNHRDGEVLRKDNNLEQGGFHGVSLHHAMTKYGQAAPANPSTDGSRQGLSVDWRTPQANEAGARVETLYTKDGQPARPGERAYRKTPDGRMVLQSQTINQQVEMVSRQESWRTPTSFDWKNTDCSTQVYLSDQVEGRTKKQWATPQAHDAQGPKTPEQIAAMRARGHGVKNLNEQACWGTPTARDHKSGRGNEDRQYKELTPMVERTQTGKLNPRWVETLMGLPVGWVMPSCKMPIVPCGEIILGQSIEQWPTPSADGDSRPGANADVPKWTKIRDQKKAKGINKQLFLTTKVMMEEERIQNSASPVTIELTNCDSLETELCQQQQNAPSEFSLTD